MLAAISVEYLHLLVKAGQFESGLELLQALPSAIRETDSIQLLWAQIGLELGLLEQVEPVFEREFAVIQEGQTLLSDLWFELQARQRAAQTGTPLDKALRQTVRRECTPPARIDFRSVNEI
jgi:hypothetical protein